MTLILNNDDIGRVLLVGDCIQVMEDAYIELAEGRGATRRRSDIITPAANRPDHIYVLKSMDGVVPKLGVGAIRLNSDIISYETKVGTLRRKKVPAAPGNRYVGLVLLFSTETGEPLAIYPDGVVQPMRVAATTALAARYLARKNARRLALLGAGWQARFQLAAMLGEFELADIRCFSTTEEKCAAFCAEMSAEHGCEVKPMPDAESAVRGADIVLCATNSLEAVISADWVEPGMHLSSIKPAEIPPEIVRASDIAAGHVKDCDPELISTHGIEIPEMPGGSHQNLAAEVDFSSLPSLPELAAGQAIGRTDDTQVTCFLNTNGLGYQFAATGAVLLERAKAAGVGREVPTDWFTEIEVP